MYVELFQRIIDSDSCTGYRIQMYSVEFVGKYILIIWRPDMMWYSIMLIVISILAGFGIWHLMAKLLGWYK